VGISVGRRIYSLGPAELGELVLLTLVVACEPPPGDGEGDMSVAQCFETEDVGTPRLVVLIGGVYTMRRNERVCRLKKNVEEASKID